MLGGQAVEGEIRLNSNDNLRPISPSMMAFKVAEPLQLHPLFGPNRLKQVSLGKALLQEEVNSFLSLPQEFSDVFAWSQDDMPSVSPTMAQHYLNLWKECRPIC